MLLKFNCFNESLGINDSLVIAGKKIFDIINSDDKTYYLIPNIKIGKYIVEVEINIKEEKDNGSFSASDSSNKKISISLSSRDKYSTLVHELKHAHRFLYRKNSNINYREKDNILSQSINQFSNLYDDEFILINFIIYFMNIDEFEAQYHSMYIELSQNKKLSKDDIDSDVHVKSYRNMLEIIGKDNFMDIIFKKIDKTRFLLMLYRNELKQDKGDLIFRNLKLSDLTYTGKFIFNMKKFLLSKNIIKLSDKEKTELYRLEKEIKKILIKNSRIIQKKLSRLYLLVNENKTLNETCNVDVGISDEDMDSKAMERKIHELTRALEHAQLKISSLETLIKVSEEDLQIKIRKKRGTKQSKE